MQKVTGPNKKNKTVGAYSQNKWQREILYSFGCEIHTWKPLGCPRNKWDYIIKIL